MKILKIYAFVLSSIFICLSCEPEEINNEKVSQTDILDLEEVGDTGGQETGTANKKD